MSQRVGLERARSLLRPKPTRISRTVTVPCASPSSRVHTLPRVGWFVEGRAPNGDRTVPSAAALVLLAVVVDWRLHRMPHLCTPEPGASADQWPGAPGPAPLASRLRTLRLSPTAVLPSHATIGCWTTLPGRCDCCSAC